MNASIRSADQTTHIKIVVTSLFAAIVVVVIGISARNVGVNADVPNVSKAGKPVNFIDQRRSNSALSFVEKIGAKLAMGKHMGEWGKLSVSGMSHKDWAQWRHLILKLRWIGLEGEARRLQMAVSGMHVKAEVARSDIARTHAH